MGSRPRGVVKIYEIPGFSRYATDDRGNVSNIDTGSAMSCYGPREIYQLFDDGGVRRKISREEIMELTFGKTEEKARSSYGRRPVKEFPMYEIDRMGDVYGARDGRRLAFKVNRNSMYYTFHKDGKRVNRTLMSLLRDNFPEDNP